MRVGRRGHDADSSRFAGAGPTPTAAPIPTPTPGREITAMALPGLDRAAGVNGRAWIVVAQQPSPYRPYEPVDVVLPPDAGPDAGPAPVPGCALLSRDQACRPQASVVAVGETDWVYGQQRITLPSGAVAAIHLAIGPLGELVPLVAAGDPLELFEARPGPL